MASVQSPLRVLFVDDDPSALAQTRQAWTGLRNGWDLVFAVGGEDAIASMVDRTFDVVVTNLQMRGVDGAAVLDHAHRHQPDSIRIVLCPPRSVEATMVALPTAHQCLAASCPQPVLWQAITRSVGLRTMLNDPRLRRLVSGVRELPVLPRAYREITVALQQPEVSIHQVARIVESDPAVYARVLQIVNSGLFGLVHRVNRPEDAVTILGLDMLRSLVLSAGVFRQLEERGGGGIDLSRFQRHAMLTARIAREIVPVRTRGADAFTAGVLHDLGCLLLQESSIAEDAGNHAAVGGYLLGLWGLPFPIVEAVAWHHTPDRVAGQAFDLVGAVHVADQLAHAVEPGFEHGAWHDAVSTGLDLDYLDLSGVLDRLPRWRELAAEVAAGAAAAV